MIIDKQYIFKSTRLGFRNWIESDIELMAAINADEIVMEFFPGIATKDQTIEFIEKMQQQFAENSFCYFAVDKLENNAFIGFIGLSEKLFEAEFTPCIDIGWRLSSEEWNKGYATEGARRCLEYANEILKLEKIVSMAPKINVKSESVMKKIGMKKVLEFEHPLLINDERLRDCVLYQITKS
ncbi:MAG: GNAT family N-acetyltransferase [Daejeonella sp.]|uniref:GNAT family N-acetyltransferase n=1 Tax=Daejeonella sp. TaxID=2805397 RepID=UPI0027337FEF|nr:GNAT family N-acetyltransferase [Daejeonella sp.]MDP3468353.1 GNAT family N-acetyltransferase [Daejeonella sp.]